MLAFLFKLHSNRKQNRVVLCIALQTYLYGLSLSSGLLHTILKESAISLLLKKSTLDKDQLSNYRPLSNRSLLSKIIETFC